ncbi:histidine--tRNA ligase [bacterium]|nr:histidine--tRNA ligase [bacterium]
MVKKKKNTIISSVKKVKKNRVVKTGTVRIKRNKRIARIRGMKDITLNYYNYWDLILKKANDLSQVFSFQKIEIPVLEREELYQRIFDFESGFFSNDIYSFTDKGRDRVVLRPSATPGIARSFLEYGFYNLEQPIKISWLGPVFRFEKTQTGKYRQFNQFNLEIYGEPNPVADFLLIKIAYSFFSELQIGTQVQVNSWGCVNCRSDYLDKLKKYLRNKKSKLCADCRKKINKTPLEIFNCEKDDCLEIVQEAPPIVDSLCDKCQVDFTKILEYLDEVEIPYNLNPFLVKDVDYYNYGPVFEFWDLNDNGEVYKGFSLGGGGRFNDMIEKLGGDPTPACGFSIGIEKTLLKMKKNNIPIDKDRGDVIFLAQLGEQARKKILGLFEELRKSGFKVRQSFTRDSLKDQLDEAGRVGAKFSLILGQKEVNDNTILLRDMESGNQEIIDYKKVKTELDKRLKNDN